MSLALARWLEIAVEAERVVTPCAIAPFGGGFGSACHVILEESTFVRLPYTLSPTDLMTRLVVYRCVLRDPCLVQVRGDLETFLSETGTGDVMRRYGATWKSVTLAACWILLMSGPVWAQSYVGIDVCDFCHRSEVTGVLERTQHPDKVLSPSEVLVTDGTGESGATCAMGTSIFDPCTVGYDTFVAPYSGFFNIDDVEYALGKHLKQRFLTVKIPLDMDASNGDPGNVGMVPANKYVMMGIQWNMAEQRWQNYHGPTVEDNWYTEDRFWNKKCGSCHTTGFDPTNDNWVEQSRSGAQHGVTCEACHGPASSHVNNPNGVKPAFPENFAGGVDGPESAAERERRLEICGQCHGRGASVPNGTYGFPFNDDAGVGYVPGEVLANYYTQTTSASRFWPDGTSKSHHQQYIDFLNSTHWTGPASFEGQLDCMTCHDSHGNGVEPGELKEGGGSGLCQTCHTDMVGAAFTAHTGGGSMTEAVMDCNDCHMPYTAKSINPYDIRSHTFRIIPPANSLEPSYLGMPNSCTSSCHNETGPGFTLSDEFAQISLFAIRANSGGSQTEVGGLFLDKDGTDLLAFWSPSTDPNHDTYRMYRTSTAASGVLAPGNWVDVTADDVDADPANESFRREADNGIDLEFFIVVDQGTYVGDAPWGHYFR